LITFAQPNDYAIQFPGISYAVCNDRMTVREFFGVILLAIAVKVFAANESGFIK
jgi:hypothetical protein